MAAVPSFLNKFANDSKYFLPLPFQWTVSFTDSGVSSAISRALSKINLNWTISDTLKWTDTDTNNILVAQEVTLPQESFEATTIGQENRGGFMPGYGVVQRTDFLQRGLTINFIETDRDIESELFRPWIIALGIDGLLNHSLKARNVNITQYGKDMSTRKQYVFDDVFPTTCEGFNLTYGDQEFIVKSVTFGFKNYKVIT
jgi:hypothetical protein